MFAYLVFYGTCVVNLVVGEYEEFATDSDAAEKPTMYRSLRDYASPHHLRSYPAIPYGDTNMGSYFGNGFHQDVMMEDLHSHPSMKTIFVNKFMGPNQSEKKAPYVVKMSMEKPYPFIMPKPYLLTGAIEKPTNAYPAMKMYATALLPTKFEKQISLPVILSKPMSYSSSSMLNDRHIFGQISVEKPTVRLKSPYENSYEKKIPALPYSMQKQLPYPIYMPPTQEKLVPIPVEKPYSIQYQIEKPLSYPMEKAIPYPVPVPIRIPIEVPVPVNVAVTRHEPVFIPIPQPRPSDSVDQTDTSEKETPDYVPQLFMSTALLKRLAAAQTNNISASKSVIKLTRKYNTPPNKESNDTELEGTAIVNKYEFLKKNNNEGTNIVNKYEFSKKNNSAGTDMVNKYELLKKNNSEGIVILNKYEFLKKNDNTSTTTPKQVDSTLATTIATPNSTTIVNANNTTIPTIGTLTSQLQQSTTEDSKTDKSSRGS